MHDAAKVIEDESVEGKLFPVFGDPSVTFLRQFGLKSRIFRGAKMANTLPLSNNPPPPPPLPLPPHPFRLPARQHANFPNC